MDDLVAPGGSEHCWGWSPTALSANRRGRAGVPPHTCASCVIHRCRNTLARGPSAPQRGGCCLLGHLRPHRGVSSRWRQVDRRRRNACGGLLSDVRPQVPLGRSPPERRPRQAVLLPGIPDRPPRAHLPLQRHRAFNFIERTLGETRRRVEVIGRLPDECSCLGLVSAVFDRASGVARRHHDPRHHPPAPRAPSPAARPARRRRPPQPTRPDHCSRGLTSPPGTCGRRRFSAGDGTPRSGWQLRAI